MPAEEMERRFDSFSGVTRREDDRERARKQQAAGIGAELPVGAAKGVALTRKAESSYKPTVPGLAIVGRVSAASWLRRGRGVGLLMALAGGLAAPACVSPHSGTITSSWCPHDATFDTLDDMEDGDAKLCNGWGKWSFSGGSGISITTPVAADGTLLMTEPTADAAAGLVTDSDTDTRAIHLTASGFVGADPTYWAFLRATFEPPGPFSVANYSAIRFSVASSTLVQIRVNVATSVTRDQAASDDFGKTISVSGGQQPTTIPFATMTQEGFGAPVAPDFADAVLLSFDFKLASSFLDFPRAINPESFDLWIDDVQLVR